MRVIQGHVDGFEGHWVLGWAIAEPDSSSCAVEIIDQNGVVVGKGRATRTRPDLRSLDKGRINFAFRIPVRVDGDQSLRVCVDGEELAGSPVQVGPGNWDGFVEVGNGRASGWLTERTANRDTPPLVELCDENGAVLTQVRSHFDVADSGSRFIPARFDAPLDQVWFGRGELLLSARVDDRTFARTRVNLRVDGFLDMISRVRCAGWLLSPDAPDRELEIEAWINGHRVATTRAARPRDDLRTLYPQSWRKGFEIQFGSPSSIPPDICEISLRLAGSHVEFLGGPFVVGDRTGIINAARGAARLAHASSHELDVHERSVLNLALGEFIARQRHGHDPVVLRSAAAAAASQTTHVIIPIYRGVDVTRDCIESVLAHRNPAKHRIVIVNDFSPEPGMAAMLAEFERQPGLLLLHNPVNLGFVKTVNRALDQVREGDVVLLNSDTRVFEGWLDELERVAYSSPDIGTVTALSNNATIFSYPHPSLATPALADVTWPELAAIALREGAGQAVDVPTGHGFCLFIKREILQRVGHLDTRCDRGYGEENHLCCTAADLGYRNVAAAGVLVEHRENVSFGPERAVLWERNRPQLEAAFPEYTPQVMAHEATEGLRRARWALDEYRLDKARHDGRGFALITRNWLGLSGISCAAGRFK